MGYIRYGIPNIRLPATEQLVSLREAYDNIIKICYPEWFGTHSSYGGLMVPSPFTFECEDKSDIDLKGAKENSSREVDNKV